MIAREKQETKTYPKYSVRNFQLPDNYIYISHLDDLGQDMQYWILPFYPDTITDTMQSNFSETTALGRSAPVFTFSNAGPRTVQIEIKLHRDMMDDANEGKSNARRKAGEDYIESLIRALQSIAVPKYNLKNKAVEPSLVALRIGKQVFIKGVVTDGIGITYSKPIVTGEKYAQVALSLKISEVDPYDATTVYNNGSYRGEVQTLRKGAYDAWGISEE